jgi:nitrate reductase alpha subunit
MENNRMSSDETTTTALDETVTDTTVEPQGDPGTDWKGEARKWEARAKADREAANKWREFEVSQKTDYEKLADELSKYKAEAAIAELKAIRYEVATAKGIPAEAMELLTGDSRESVEASAEKLAALIAAQSKTTAPRPDVNQGRAATGGNSTKDQFAAALADLL